MSPALPAWHRRKTNRHSISMFGPMRTVAMAGGRPHTTRTASSHRACPRIAYLSMGHGTLTPCCALTVLRSKLVGPEGWQNAAGGRPIGHVCRLWYPYGGLRRFGGSPATLGELVVWAGHGGRVGSPAPPRGASEVAENVIYTYSRALGLGYAPRSGTLTPRTECWGAQALLLSRVAKQVIPV